MNRPTPRFGWTLIALAGVIALAILAAGTVSEAAMQITETPSPTPTQPPTATPTAIPSPTPTNPAPTLVPPTPLPEQSTPAPIPRPTQSALANVQALSALRVGTYFNAYPFSWLNERGEIVGYEADIVRAIGIELGIEIEFVQVTRHNARGMLLGGDVDVLIGQQIHARDVESALEFTHPIYLNQERMVVRQDSDYTELRQLAGRSVAVAIGSRSERALRHWLAETGVSMDVRTTFTESEALDALANGEVEGMVGELDSLRRAGRQQMSLVDEPVLIEPYAMVVRRWDVNTRNVLNRSLQRLKASGRLDEIFAEWFPDDTMDFTLLVPVYTALYADERTLADFPTDIPYPANPVLDRIQSGLPVRVAGLIGPGESGPAHVRITDAFNRALVEEMARRWNTPIEFVPNSVMNAVDLVANGQADLAVGVSPRWDGADRAEYSLPYIQHGKRLLVPANARIAGFADMLGTGWWIGYFADDAGDAEDIQKYAEYFRVGGNIQTFAIQREADAIYIMTVENNIKAIFGDSLRLLALMREGDGNAVKMLDTWYGDLLPVTFAGPRNDADFRALVDFTLQDMARDGTYQRLWNAHFGLGDPLSILAWPDRSPDSAP